MGRVWDIPNNKIKANQKFVLLTYADHADHNGNNVFPAQETIAKKTGYSRRTVIRITKELVDAGFMIEKGFKEYGTKIYSIKFDGCDKLSHVTNGGDKLSKKPAQMSHKPSINHHSKPSLKEPATPVQEKPKPERKPNPVWLMAEAVAEVCQLDLNLKNVKGKVMNFSKQLVSGQYTPEQVREYYKRGGWWYRQDWRGKKGDLPQPHSILNTIKQAAAVTQMLQTNQPTPEELRALVEAGKQDKIGV